MSQTNFRQAASAELIKSFTQKSVKDNRVKEPIMCRFCGNKRYWVIRCEYCGHAEETISKGGNDASV